MRTPLIVAAHLMVALATGCASSPSPVDADSPQLSKEPKMTSEIWADFIMGGEHVGFMQERRMKMPDGSTQMHSLTTFRMGDEIYENGYFCTYDKPLPDGTPGPWRATGYFGIEDGKTFWTAWMRRGQQLVKVEDGTIVTADPPRELAAGTFGTADVGLLLRQVEPRAGSTFAGHSLNEGDGQASPFTLTVKGDKADDGRWRVDELRGGRPSRVFWLDNERAVQTWDWSGGSGQAVSHRMTREAALAGLPAEWRKLDDFALEIRLPE
ncbi:MAG: hypothetical protein AB7S36_08665 [Planctomycetota bacterium]